MRDEEEVVTLVIIELPPFEDEVVIEITLGYDTKAIPWNYRISEIDAITRSRRCCGHAKVIEEKAVNKEEDKEFPIVIKTSEFNVVNQLKKMPAQIYLLDLFKSSEKYKNTLLKILKEVHVLESIDNI